MRTLTRMAVWMVTAVCLAAPVQAQTNVSTGLVVIAGAGHGFRAPEHRTKATATLVAWFERHLTAR